MGLGEMYRTIREARRQHLPGSAEWAGDEGERLALASAESLIRRRAARLGVRCYPAVRVPRPGDRGKYEIDLLVAGPFGLACLEVKHWGGEVEEVRPGTWMQLASRGDSREYEDPLALVRTKSEAVQIYLGGQGIEVSSQAMTAVVVLTNPRLTLGPRLSQVPGLVRLAALEEFLTPWVNPNKPGFWGGLARSVGLARTIPPPLPNISPVTQALDRLPTWDLIGLNGGRVIKGDVARSGIPLTDGRTLTRSDATLVRFHLPRSWLFGWFATPCVSWVQQDGLKRVESLRLGSTIAIRPAGQRNDQDVPVEHVQAVRFGWQDQAFFQAPRPPLESYQPGTVFQGTVVGVQEFGIFVNLDGQRDGLVHVSKLGGRRPSTYQQGQAATVRVVRTAVKDGKERIELELLSD